MKNNEEEGRLEEEAYRKEKELRLDVYKRQVEHGYPSISSEGI